MSKLIPIDRVQSRILIIRGRKVLLDADLAALYGVSTKRLNEQVKRNKSRFPSDFIIHLTKQEKAEVVANCDHLRALKFSPVLPYAFTEHGALMVSSILNTVVAVRTGIYIVRAFVKIREWLSEHKELNFRIQKLETRMENHGQHIQFLWDAIQEMMALPAEKSPKIKGFKK